MGGQRRLHVFRAQAQAAVPVLHGHHGYLGIGRKAQQLPPVSVLTGPHFPHRPDHGNPLRVEVLRPPCDLPVQIPRLIGRRHPGIYGGGVRRGLGLLHQDGPGGKLLGGHRQLAVPEPPPGRAVTHSLLLGPLTQFHGIILIYHIQFVNKVVSSSQPSGAAGRGATSPSPGCGRPSFFAG